MSETVRQVDTREKWGYINSTLIKKRHFRDGERIELKGSLSTFKSSSPGHTFAKIQNLEAWRAYSTWWNNHRGTRKCHDNKHSPPKGTKEKFYHETACILGDTRWGRLLTVLSTSHPFSPSSLLVPHSLQFFLPHLRLLFFCSSEQPSIPALLPLLNVPPSYVFALNQK